MSGAAAAFVQRMAAALVLVAAMAACSPKPELREFSPPGESFTVQMPGTPTHEQGSRESDAGTITAHVWISEFDGVVYAVNYQRIPEAAQPRLAAIGLDAMYAEAQRNLMRSSHARRTVSSSSTAGLLGGRRTLAGMEYVLELEGGATMTVRVFVHDNVLYQVATTVPAGAWYNQELFAERFRDSFTIRD